MRNIVINIDWLYIYSKFLYNKNQNQKHKHKIYYNKYIKNYNKQAL